MPYMPTNKRVAFVYDGSNNNRYTLRSRKNLGLS